MKWLGWGQGLCGEREVKESVVLDTLLPGVSLPCSPLVQVMECCDEEEKYSSVRDVVVPTFVFLKQRSMCKSSGLTRVFTCVFIFN